MADMEVAVRFRRKACDHSTAMFAGGEIGGYYFSDKI
jgi:hypothetical protein